MSPSARQALSPAFAHPELNGETLLTEVTQLREGGVLQRHLEDCAVALRSVRGLRLTEVVARVRELAGVRFSSHPELGALLGRWSARLRTDADVDAFIGHMERVASLFGILSALRQARDRGLTGDAE